jgi:hypothetical protein
MESGNRNEFLRQSRKDSGEGLWHFPGRLEKENAENWVFLEFHERERVLACVSSSEKAVEIWV